MVKVIVDPESDRGLRRSHRGGGYEDDSYYCQTVRRDCDAPTDRYQFLSFRLCLT